MNFAIIAKAIVVTMLGLPFSSCLLSTYEKSVSSRSVTASGYAKDEAGYGGQVRYEVKYK